MLRRLDRLAQEHPSVRRLPSNVLSSRKSFARISSSFRHTVLPKSRSAHLKVTGPTYFRSEVADTVKSFSLFGSPTSNGLSEVEAVIEKRDAADDPANELSWKPIDATRVLLIQNPATRGEWEGDVSFATPQAPGLMRLS